MRPRVVLLIVATFLAVVCLAQDHSQYRLTATVEQMPPTSEVLLKAGCSWNCATNDLECKSRTARNYQLIELSDGNTYEVKCVPGESGLGCPVGLGKYPARITEQELYLATGKDQQSSKEQKLQVLSKRKTVPRGPEEKPCKAEKIAEKAPLK